MHTPPRFSTGCLACCFCYSDIPPTEIYTLSLHDALPISGSVEDAVERRHVVAGDAFAEDCVNRDSAADAGFHREIDEIGEHTSELQSQFHLVCRLLLEKKKANASASTLTPTSVSSTRLM